jgi:hypothetical protein
MSDSLFEVEYHPDNEVVIRIKGPSLHMLPDPAKGHLTAARREIMLALREMLDKSLEKNDKMAEGTKKTTKKRKIIVE